MLSAQCACPRGTAGLSCDIDCPRVNGTTCSGHGECDEGSTGSGRCICVSGFGGTYCNVTCVGSPPCSGHGLCSSSGACVCAADGTVGFWSGESCSACIAGYGGSNCNVRCPTNPVTGAVCSGHGVCGSNVQCACDQSTVGGFWTGALCDECVAGYFGPSCSSECTGGACFPCNGNGRCNDGVVGNGQCTCFPLPGQVPSAVGVWQGNACSQCGFGRFGERCTQLCPTNSSGTVCGRGKCNDGVDGNGTCTCSKGFAVEPLTGLCTECAAGYYGGECRECPVTENGTCNGRGICHDGRSGSGQCTCEGRIGGTACDSNCPAASSGIICGNGTCLTNGTCTCARLFALDSFGACDACIAGNYGKDCDLACPLCLFGACQRLDGSCLCDPGYWGSSCANECPGGSGNPCSGHGTCNASTGVCKCASSLREGFYVGEMCDTCSPRYLSDSCSIPCPVFGGRVCSDRGLCYNGNCSSCAPLESEYGLISYVCGVSCNLIDAECFTSACPLGYYGAVCNQLCPGASVGNVSSTCSGHGKCDADGICKCAVGYFGSDCSGSCPAAMLQRELRICGGRGSCSKGACRCFSGFFGVACEAECPGGSSLPCSMKGVCTPAGTCVCNAGSAGAACELACPGGTASPCSYHGECTSVGVCRCYANATAGYYSGPSCGSCLPPFTGKSCKISCPPNRGAVLNGRCKCFPGYTGEECSINCPVDASGNICSSRGNCSLATMGCQCERGYYGADCSVHCSTESCKAAGLHRPQCNITDGSCECQGSAQGFWAGPKCDVCAANTWGDECNVPCPCVNGVCDRTTGACSCFGDSLRGFWTGATCSQCRVGFFGQTCITPNVEMSQATLPKVTAKSKPSPPGYGWAITDSIGGVTFQGTTTSNVLTVLQVLLTGEVSSFSVPLRALPLHSGATSANCDSTSRGMVLNRTFLLLVCNNSKLVAPRSLSDLRALAQHQGRDFGVQDASDPLPVYTLSVGMSLSPSSSWLMLDLVASGGDGAVVCTVASLNDTAVEVVCSDKGRRIFHDAEDPLLSLSRLRLVRFCEVTSDLQHLVIIGTIDPLVTANSVMIAIHVVSMERSMLPMGDSVGVVLRCVMTNMTYDSAASSDASCLSQRPVGPTTGGTFELVLIAITVETLTVSGFVVVSSSTLAVNVTAMGMDALFNTGVVAFNYEFQPSQVVTFRLSTSALVGMFVLSGSYVATTLSIDSEKRLMIGTMEDSYTTAVLSMNLFGVRSVTPAVVDMEGGANVTVEGEGFDASLGDDVWCVLSSTRIRGKLVNANVVSCPNVPRAANAAGSCTPDPINIAFGTRVTTQTLVGVSRPPSATLSHIVTDLTSVGYGSFDLPAVMTIIGFGFVDSSNAACRLVTADGGVIVFTSPCSFINTSAVRCRQPSPLPLSSVPTRIVYTHDGAYYGQSSALYTIVGPPAGIAAFRDDALLSATLPSATLTSQYDSPVPPFSIATVDSLGNRRLVFDARRGVEVACSSNVPSLAVVGYPEAIPFSDRTVRVAMMSGGIAVFDSIVLRTPTAGLTQLYCYNTMDNSVWTVIHLRVVSGVPIRVGGVVSPSWVAGVTSTTILLPNPVMWLEDAAGNIVDDAAMLPPVAYLVTTKRSPDAPPLISRYQGALTLSAAHPQYEFSGVGVRTAFGVPCTIVLSTDGNHTASLTLTVPSEQCVAATEYGTPLGFRCLPCPAHGVCDGTTTVLVQTGFWRGTKDSFDFLPCTPPTACFSASSCGVGYRGPVCAVCEEGFGRSLEACVRCQSPPEDRVLVALLFLGVCVMLYGMTIFSMPVTTLEDYARQRTRDVPQTRGFAVAMKIMLSHVQLLMVVPFAQLEVPSWIGSIVSVSDTGSSLTPNLAFLSCTLAPSPFEKLVLVLCCVPVFFAVFCLLSAFKAWRVSRQSARDLEEEERQVVIAKAMQRRDDEAARGAFGGERRRSSVRPRDNNAFDEVLDDDDDDNDRLNDEQHKKHTKAVLAQRRQSHIVTDYRRQARQLTYMVEHNEDRKAIVRNRAHVLDEDADEDDGVALVKVLQHELKEEHGDQVKAMQSRFVNMASVSLIGILFYLYPTLVRYATIMLQCRDIALPGGVVAKVLTADTTLDCTSEHYTGLVLPVAAAVLAIAGVGVPLLAAAIVIFIARTTCSGDHDAAKQIFFFVTGGYRRGLWFWECVSLLKKLLIVLAVSLVPHDNLKMLCCLWITLLALALNVTLKPWTEPDMSRGEAVSLGCLALTYGLCQLVYAGTLRPPESNAVFLFVFCINGLVLLRLLTSVLTGVKTTVVSFLQSKQIYFGTALQDVVIALTRARVLQLADRVTDVGRKALRRNRTLLTSERLVSQCEASLCAVDRRLSIIKAIMHRMMHDEEDKYNGGIAPEFLSPVGGVGDAEAQWCGVVCPTHEELPQQELLSAGSYERQQHAVASCLVGSAISNAAPPTPNQQSGGASREGSHDWSANDSGSPDDSVTLSSGVSSSRDTPLEHVVEALRNDPSCMQGHDADVNDANTLSEVIGTATSPTHVPQERDDAISPFEQVTAVATPDLCDPAASRHDDSFVVAAPPPLPPPTTFFSRGASLLENSRRRGTVVLPPLLIETPLPHCTGESNSRNAIPVSLSDPAGSPAASHRPLSMSLTLFGLESTPQKSSGETIAVSTIAEVHPSLSCDEDDDEGDEPAAPVDSSLADHLARGLDDDREENKNGRYEDIGSQAAPIIEKADDFYAPFSTGAHRPIGHHTRAHVKETDPIRICIDHTECIADETRATMSRLAVAHRFAALCVRSSDADSVEVEMWLSFLMEAELQVVARIRHLFAILAELETMLSARQRLLLQTRNRQPRAPEGDEEAALDFGVRLGRNFVALEQDHNSSAEQSGQGLIGCLHVGSLHSNKGVPIPSADTSARMVYSLWVPGSNNISRFECTDEPHPCVNGDTSHVDISPSCLVDIDTIISNALQTASTSHSSRHHDLFRPHHDASDGAALARGGAQMRSGSKRYFADLMPR